MGEAVTVGVGDGKVVGLIVGEGDAVAVGVGDGETLEFAENAPL